MLRSIASLIYQRNLDKREGLGPLFYFAFNKTKHRGVIMYKEMKENLYRLANNRRATTIDGVIYTIRLFNQPGPFNHQPMDLQMDLLVGVPAEDATLITEQMSATGNMLSVEFNDVGATYVVRGNIYGDIKLFNKFYDFLADETENTQVSPSNGSIVDVVSKLLMYCAISSPHTKDMTASEIKKRISELVGDDVVEKAVNKITS